RPALDPRSLPCLHPGQVPSRRGHRHRLASCRPSLGAEGRHGPAPDPHSPPRHCHAGQTPSRRGGRRRPPPPQPPSRPADPPHPPPAVTRSPLPRSPPTATLPRLRPGASVAGTELSTWLRSAFSWTWRPALPRSGSRLAATPFPSGPSASGTGTLLPIWLTSAF